MRLVITRARTGGGTSAPPETCLRTMDERRTDRS